MLHGLVPHPPAQPHLALAVCAFRCCFYCPWFSHVLQIPNGAKEVCLACGHEWIGHFGSEVPPPSSSAFYFLKGICGTDCGGYWSVSICLHQFYGWAAPHIYLRVGRFGIPVAYASVEWHGRRICRSRLPPQPHHLDNISVQHPAQAAQATQLAVSAELDPLP